MERIINIISRPENINQKTGNPNYFRLCKPVEERGVGHTRQKLQKWWNTRYSIRSMVNKYKRKRTKNSYKPYHLEMEIKLKDWILQERALGLCIGGFVIRVKALEISSQLGLSPRTLKNKRRALARDLEKN